MNLDTGGVLASGKSRALGLMIFGAKSVHFRVFFQHASAVQHRHINNATHRSTFVPDFYAARPSTLNPKPSAEDSKPLACRNGTLELDSTSHCYSKPLNPLNPKP